MKTFILLMLVLLSSACTVYPGYNGYHDDYHHYHDASYHDPLDDWLDRPVWTFDTYWYPGYAYGGFSYGISYYDGYSYPGYWPWRSRYWSYSPFYYSNRYGGHYVSSRLYHYRWHDHYADRHYWDYGRYYYNRPGDHLGARDRLAREMRRLSNDYRGMHRKPLYGDRSSYRQRDYRHQPVQANEHYYQRYRHVENPVQNHPRRNHDGPYRLDRHRGDANEYRNRRSQNRLSPADAGGGVAGSRAAQYREKPRGIEREMNDRPHAREQYESSGDSDNDREYSRPEKPRRAMSREINGLKKRKNPF